MKKKYVGAVDQGTTSTRFILFNKMGLIEHSYQLEHKQIFPKPGWVEHDPLEIWENTCTVITETLKRNCINPDEIDSIGITNQRETTVVWDRFSGKPLYNAIVWQDTRTGDIIARAAGSEGPDRYREKIGLPLNTYFAGSKMQWLSENSEAVKSAVKKGRAVFGTIDSWVVWNLTGGADGGSLITDVTNASRTLLMDLQTLQWDSEMMGVFDVNPDTLPEIRSSSAAEPYGFTRKDGPFGSSIPVCGILGDQQAAMFGQACFNQGNSKNTYGTGCFMLANTGEDIVHSKYGLLTTVLYRIGREKPCYALEGSVAVAGSLVQWIRDNLGLIKNSPDIEELALKADDNGGVYFVPAFSGLFAPRWRPDSRGLIIGLTGYAKSSHIARAVLESTAFQTLEIFDAMEKDAGIEIDSLKVDGGMTANNLLMQFQADLLNVPVIKPVVAETTALGAAYAAGLATGFWADRKELSEHWVEDRRWLPEMAQGERESRYKDWNRAVERTYNWEQ